MVKAIMTLKNEIIPFWDPRISYDKSPDYGERVKIPEEMFSNFVDVMFDLKTKTLSTGIELDHYPDESKLTFKVDDEVYVEVEHRYLRESKIKKIVYEKFDLDIKKGRKIEQYVINRIKDIQIVADELYAIRSWKPFYILDDDTK